MAIEREQFRSYMMGWTDRAGAVGRNRREIYKHRTDLQAEYDRGFSDGGEAKNAAAATAAARLGYDLEHAVINR